MAMTVVSNAKRITGVLRNVGLGLCWSVLLQGSLVKCFTIAVNIDGGPQKGSPPKALHFRLFLRLFGAFPATPPTSPIGPPCNERSLFSQCSPVSPQRPPPSRPGG